MESYSASPKQVIYPCPYSETPYIDIRKVLLEGRRLLDSCPDLLRKLLAAPETPVHSGDYVFRHSGFLKCTHRHSGYTAWLCSTTGCLEAPVVNFRFCRRCTKSLPVNDENRRALSRTDNAYYLESSSEENSDPFVQSERKPKSASKQATPSTSSGLKRTYIQTRLNKSPKSSKLTFSGAGHTTSKTTVVDPREIVNIILDCSQDDESNEHGNFAEVQMRNTTLDLRPDDVVETSQEMDVDDILDNFFSSGIYGNDHDKVLGPETSDDILMPDPGSDALGLGSVDANIRIDEAEAVTDAMIPADEKLASKHDNQLAKKPPSIAESSSTISSNALSSISSPPQDISDYFNDLKQFSDD